MTTVFVSQALVKKGIGHLSEKELKERNKCIQEENRRELQKVGAVEQRTSQNMETL